MSKQKITLRIKLKTTFKKFMCVCAMTFVMLGASQVLIDKKAAACCLALSDCKKCKKDLQRSIETEWGTTETEIKSYVQQQFSIHRTWITDILWEDNLLPALMMMADQMSAVAMQQTQIIGSFIDAKHQMETQRVLQTIRARAHKDYHPSAGMCEFGTSVKSLAASERKAELNAHVMSQRSQDRHLGNTNTSAAAGQDRDLESRLNQYKEKFCDARDNHKGLDILCLHANGVGAADQLRVNKDLDYTRTLEHPWTLNIDFTDSQLTNAEEEIMALSNNLYGHKVFKRINETELERDSGGDPRAFTSKRGNYMDARALLAKLSVAENSFNSIASMKAAGTSSSREFLESILIELGVNATNGPPDDVMRLLGMSDEPGDPDTEIGPSYHAQMEVLTKKIYQNPDFYTNLYDKPANVERKKVAMQAIGLMQKFDLFKSYLRNEANLSVLLELAIIDLQGHIENELSE